MFSWMDPISEYALKLCFCLFNKKTCELLIRFFYILCMEAHAYMGSTKFKCESFGITIVITNYNNKEWVICQTVKARVRSD